MGLAYLAGPSFLRSEKRTSGEGIVQCISNFPIDADYYTQVLQQRGYQGKVVSVSIDEYEQKLLMKKGRFHAFLHMTGLDFYKRVALDANIDKVVFFNIVPKVAKKWDLSRLPKEKLVLFMWEPRTVIKEMYLPKVTDCFAKVYTWDDSLLKQKHFAKFHYPVLRPMQAFISSFEEKKLCTLVASQLHSDYPQELYSERTKAIEYFEKVGEEGFEFYGRGWKGSDHPSYRGAPEDKISTIKDYRFVICYENTSDAPGYITEKIFDCFAAGVVPIYWGAPNVTEYIPEECFIDRRRFGSMEQLHQFLKSMSQEEYEGYLTHIRSYLHSEKALCFQQQQLDQAFYEAVIGSP